MSAWLRLNATLPSYVLAVDGNGTIVTILPTHPTVDDALGEELLAAFKGYIEKPIAMLA